jgi:hypothetical protein
MFFKDAVSSDWLGMGLKFWMFVKRPELDRMIVGLVFYFILTLKIYNEKKVQKQQQRPMCGLERHLFMCGPAGPECCLAHLR